MREDNQSRIDDRRNVASGMAEQQRAIASVQDSDLRILAGMSKSITDTILEGHKRYRQGQFEKGFSQYWMGSGDPKEISSYEEGKAKLTAVGTATDNTARSLAKEGAQPLALSHLRELAGDQKAGYMMAMAQSKGMEYGQWFGDLIRNDSTTQIPLGDRTITPSDALKGGPEAAAVAAWARYRYVQMNGLEGANLAMLNDKMFPSMREHEARILSKVNEQANRDRGDRETQDTVGIYISQLRTNPGEAFNMLNRKLPSVINPETGNYYTAKESRELGLKLLHDAIRDGKEAGITKETLDKIKESPDLDGSSTWGKRWSQLFLGLDRDLFAARQEDLKQEQLAKVEEANTVATGFLELGKQKGGYTDAEIDTFKFQWRDQFPLIPVPSTIEGYITKNKIQDDVAQKWVLRKLANGEPIYEEDMRGFSDSIRVKYKDTISKHNEQVGKNPEVIAGFSRIDSELKLSLKTNSLDPNPHPTYETAKYKARQIYLESYKTFLEASKSPADARSKALDLVVQRIEAGRKGIGEFAISLDVTKPNEQGFLGFYPKGDSAAAFIKAEHTRRQMADSIKKDPNAVNNTLLIPQPDIAYLEQMQKDPTLPPPASILVLTDILHRGGYKGSYYDVVDAQYSKATGKEFKKPEAVSIIDSVDPRIKQLFFRFPTARRTARGQAGMPWHKTKVPNGWGELIEQSSSKYGVDPALLAGLLDHESWHWNPKARSNKGLSENNQAKGLAQLMPETARELGVTNPDDPKQAIPAAAKYLSKMLNSFGGDAELALRAYNQGEGGTRQFPGGKDRQAREYPSLVLKQAAIYGYGGQGYSRPEVIHPVLKKFLPGELTSPMGMRNHPVHGVAKMHKGDDYAIPENKSLGFNTPVTFLESGYQEGGAGNWMAFRLPNGHEVRMMHLNQAVSGLKPGDLIPAGKSIGLSGKTGGVTGPHLHAEEYGPNGTLLNPSRSGGAMNYITHD
jgi:murein DD-endopeptidase MepM/ murein hydrolase activator NlpD